uniref:Ig-like domain-containing protein n=1 Tax=Cacopsylla melanoneura TaxID=428564 RepID=A0A8D8W3L9_9HEMI
MKPTAKLVETLTVIEGEKLRLECIVMGSPLPTVEWRVGNTSYLGSQDRVKLKIPRKCKILQIHKTRVTGTILCFLFCFVLTEYNLSRLLFSPRTKPQEGSPGYS